MKYGIERQQLKVRDKGNNVVGTSMRCLFCKQDSSDSSSVEHIIPESIGNKKRVLPAGVVCDKCNNYFACKVEEPILNDSWMRNLKAYHQVPNKKNKFPSMVGYIAGTEIPINMRKSREGKFQLAAERICDQPKLNKVIEEGFTTPLLFKIEDNLPEREMSRFLCKMALEAVAELFCRKHDKINNTVHTPFFDNIRTYARYGTNFKNWPFYQRSIFPQETLMRHTDTNEWVQAGFGYCLFMNKHRETLFAFCLYGIEFVINVGGPSIEGYKQWLIDHNNISPMIERLGCQLIVEGEGRARKHYLQGSFDNKKGLEFDKKHGYSTSTSSCS